MSATAMIQKSPRRASPGCTMLVATPNSAKTQTPDRDAAEDADDVVDGRMVGALLVAVVQALEAKQQDPERDCEEEGQILEAGLTLSAVDADGSSRLARTNASTSPATSAASSIRRTSAPRR